MSHATGTTFVWLWSWLECVNSSEFWVFMCVHVYVWAFCPTNILRITSDAFFYELSKWILLLTLSNRFRKIDAAYRVSLTPKLYVSPWICSAIEFKVWINYFDKGCV